MDAINNPCDPSSVLMACLCVKRPLLLQWKPKMNTKWNCKRGGGELISLSWICLTRAIIRTKWPPEIKAGRLTPNGKCTRRRREEGQKFHLSSSEFIHLPSGLTLPSILQLPMDKGKKERAKASLLGPEEDSRGTKGCGQRELGISCKEMSLLPRMCCNVHWESVYKCASILPIDQMTISSSWVKGWSKMRVYLLNVSSGHERRG